MIECKTGLVALDGHLDTMEVRDGQKITEGQTIGTSGWTGHPDADQPAFEDHLHLQLYQHNNLLNPETFLNDPKKQEKYSEPETVTDKEKRRNDRDSHSRRNAPVTLTKPVTSACSVDANSRGKRALLICQNGQALTLSVLRPDGARLPLPTSVEISIDDSSNVLLNDTNNPPSASAFDQPLIAMDLDASGPQWHPSGEWLVFHTSDNVGNMGEKMLSIGVSARTLYAVIRREKATTWEVAAYDMDAVLQRAERVLAKSAKTAEESCRDRADVALLRARSGE